MSRLRDTASSRVFRGKWRMHRFRLLQSPPGRAQDQRLRHGIESVPRSRALSSHFSCAHNARRWLFDPAAFRTFSATRSAKPSRAGSNAPASTTAGFRHRSASSSSASNAGSVRTVAATGRYSRDGNHEKPPGLRAAWGFSGNFRSAQFLCRVYTESSFSALHNCSDLFLWSRGQLDLGHCGSLRHQQRLRRSRVHLITEGQ